MPVTEIDGRRFANDVDGPAIGLHLVNIEQATALDAVDAVGAFGRVMRAAF